MLTLTGCSNSTPGSVPEVIAPAVTATTALIREATPATEAPEPPVATTTTSTTTTTVLTERDEDAPSFPAENRLRSSRQPN